MRIVTKPSEYMASLNGVMEFFELNSRPIGAHVGTGKQAQAKALAEKTGYRKGFAEMMACLLTEIRCKRFVDEEVVTVIDGYTVLKEIIAPFEERWGNWPKDPEERNKAIMQLAIEVGDAMENLINDPLMVEARAERHRTAVLAGTEEPTDEDREWLQAKREAAAAEQARLDELLG